MKILYFAKFRQIIGKSSEDLEIPDSVKTVGELVEYLKERDQGCAAAFSNVRLIKAAINQNHVPLSASIKDATEVALFPPVTGG